MRSSVRVAAHSHIRSCLEATYNARAHAKGLTTSRLPPRWGEISHAGRWEGAWRIWYNTVEQGLEP